MCMGGSPSTPAVTAAVIPQPSQVPQAAAVRANVAGNGGAPTGGPGGGTASTFLSGTGGVDPSTLTLGKNALLGM